MTDTGKQKPNTTDAFGPSFNLKLEIMVEGQDLVNEWNLRYIFAICFLKIVCLNKVYQSLTLRWKHDEK